jgi:hypothetical protein
MERVDRDVRKNRKTHPKRTGGNNQRFIREELLPQIPISQAKSIGLGSHRVHSLVL